MGDSSHKIDISGLLASGRQVMLVEDAVPIEPFEGITFPSPVRVRIELRYADHLLEVRGEIEADARGECGSCLEDVERHLDIDIDERIDPHVGRDEDPFGESNVLTGSRLDVADLTQQLLLSELPMGLRCSDGCRGLCGTCGANMNTSMCSCDNGDSRGKSKVEDPA